MNPVFVRVYQADLCQAIEAEEDGNLGWIEIRVHSGRILLEGRRARQFAQMLLAMTKGDLP